MLLTIANHGPLITSTNFFASDHAKNGKLYLSVNAGAVRLLVPPACESAIPDMAAATEVVVSRGPWPAAKGGDSLELLFEDGTDSPFSVHLDSNSFDRLPPAEDAGREWVCTVWVAHRGDVPRRAIEKPCWYRVVSRLPWLKPRS